MAVSVEQLITELTEEQALDQCLDILVSLGFPARSWQAGSVPRSLVQLVAKLRADASATWVAVARGGFNELAAGGWLTLFSASHYENTRQDAVRTRGDVRLAVASGSGPYTKAIGEIVVKASAAGLTYRNTEEATLTSATPTDVLFEADAAGAAGNVADDAVDTLVTSLAGVSVVAPGPVDWTSVTGGVSGADAESDPELRTRNRSKWSSLGIGGMESAYRGWALEAQPLVTRVGIDSTNALGPGVVGVYLADASGGVADTADVVKDYLLGTDGVGRHPIGPDPTVAAATNVPVTITYTATYSATTYTADADAQAAVEDALIAYVASVPVGGYSEGASTKVLPLGGLYAAAVAVPGIINVVLTSPTASTVLTVSQVATISGGAPTGTATAAA